MSAWCRIELFGGLRVVEKERTIARFYSRKAAALLAFLAYHRDRAHPREVLIEMLWPWASNEAGRHSLSQALSSLRRQLEPPDIPRGAVLVADRSQVQLRPGATATDVDEFAAALHAAEQATDPIAREHELEEAVRLYRGELLSGLYEPWIPQEQVRLSEEFVGAVVVLAKLVADRGSVDGAISHLRKAVATEPLLEQPYRELIRLFTERGEPPAALKTYQDLERVLADEVGEQPSAETRALLRAVERRDREQLSGSADVLFTAKPPVQRPRRAPLPTGVVTILLARSDQDRSDREVATDRLLDDEFRRHGGVEIGVERPTPTVAVAFDHAADALNCAASCQLRALRQGSPDEPLARLRIAIHSVDLTPGPDGQYPSGSLDRVERLLQATHPAQILCSEASAGLLRYDLNGGLQLRDLGVYRLRGATTSERVFQLDFRDGESQRPPLNAESGHASHLPLRLTRFFGRQQEIEKLREMLTDDARLVTVIGAPGCGKTRLSIEVAAGLEETYRGAVWFVPLADMRKASGILDHVLDALRIQRSPGATPLDQIAAAIAEQPALILFDNFEHLIPSAGQLRGLLERLPGLRCLVTSRRGLGLTAERLFPVRPLPVPRAASLEVTTANESVQLFVDRAQAVKPDFQLTRENTDVLAELCQWLDGVPLAIELAAAKSQVHGPRQIIEQLRAGEELVSRSADAHDRHRSISTAVEWSYTLLAPGLQRFLAGLSVFRGGWTAEAAEVVCAEPLALDYLAELQDCSLVVVDERSSLEPRFRMLEMIRACAREHLTQGGGEKAARDRHLDHFVALVEESRRVSFGPSAKRWVDRVARDLDNIIAAQDWCDSAEDGTEKGLRIAGSLFYFWGAWGDKELARYIVRRALDRPYSGPPSRYRAAALSSAATLEMQAGDIAIAQTLYEQALEIARSVGDKRGTAAYLHNIAQARLLRGDRDRLEQMFEEALTLNLQIGNQQNASANLSFLAQLAIDRRDFTRAEHLIRELMRISKEAGSRGGYGRGLEILGGLLHTRCEHKAACSTLEQALTIYREEGDRHGVARVLSSITEVELQCGETTAALQHAMDAMRVCRETGASNIGGHVLFDVAKLMGTASRDAATSRQDLQRATQICSAALALHRMANHTCEQERHAAEITMPGLRDALGPGDFDAASRVGETMAWDEAVSCALDWLESR
jgi:predicted ATPase/DNA-binding SARP family transcriptional activator